MAIWTACLDACVLVPVGLCDSLLSIAATGIYRPVWSDRILEEVLANARRVPRVKIERRMSEMNAAFPDALITDWQRMLAVVPQEVHEKDRHVVAAALRAQANVIVTANLRDFPAQELESLSLLVQDPDDFLVTQFEVNPLLAASGVRQQLARLQNPHPTADEHIDSIRATLPRYADVLSEFRSLLDP